MWTSPHAPPTIWDELTPLVGALPYAAMAAAAAFVVAAVVETARWIRDRRRDAAAARGRLGRLVAFLILAGAVWPLAVRINDAEALRRQMASLRMTLAWIVLALPALRLTAGAGLRRWARWCSLAVADLFVGAMLVVRASYAWWQLDLGRFLAFVAIAHLAVALGWIARGVAGAGWRFGAWAALLVLAADFFVPPAATAERRAASPASPVRTAAARRDLRQAFFTADGGEAIARTAAGQLLRINLANGRTQPWGPKTARPALLLTPEASRRTFVAVFTAGPGGRVRRYAESGGLRDVIDGDLPFAPAAAAAGPGWLMVAGEGRGANALLCGDAYAVAGGVLRLDDACRALFLPAMRIGGLLPSRTTRTVFAAEGDRWLASGSRLFEVDHATGAIVRWVAIGPGVGSMVEGGRRSTLFVARPGRGYVDERAPETLHAFGALAGPAGDDLLAFDGQRNLLLAASRQTGYLGVYDLMAGRRLTRAPIGAGIASLDYHEASGAALLCLNRGLVVVRLTELPELLDR